MSFNYLKELRNIYEKLNLLNIIFILGNKTCDMDSAISCYLLSIAKNLSEDIITITSGNPTINSNTDKIYLPVLNCPRGSLKNRLEVKYIFDTYKINEDDFWYISDEIFSEEKLFQYNNDKKIETSIILVDHTILDDSQIYLSKFVIELYDHHLLDKYDKNFYPNLQKMNIKYPVGSCTTLILNDYFMKKFPSCIVDPTVAVAPVILDSKNFKDSLYGIRWVDMDKFVYKQIKGKITEKFKKKKFFNLLKEVKHNKINNLNLGIKELIFKDQKKFIWNHNNAFWSSFPIDFTDIENKFGMNGLLEVLRTFYENKTKEKGENIFFISSSSIQGKKKLFTLFNPYKFPFGDDFLKTELEKKTKENFYSLSKKTIYNENIKFGGLMYFIQVNNNYSRKVMEPILNHIFSSETTCEENHSK